MATRPIVDEWFELTRKVMPSLAAERGWPVRFDHCFQRILLDNAVGAKWTTMIASPAYRNASDTQIAEAIALGRAAVSDTLDLAELNRRSLTWRGKAKKPAPRNGKRAS